MNSKIEATPDFARDLKQLAKRYPSLKDDYRDFLDSLRKSPLQGEPLGKHLRNGRRFPAVRGTQGMCRLYGQYQGTGGLSLPLAQG